MTRVLLFGRLRDLADWREKVFDPPPPTLFALRSLIAVDNADLDAALDGPGVQTAVDRRLVRGDVALLTGSEVAFLPPMSGG